MLPISQRADQPATLSLRQASVGRVPDECVPEQADLPTTLLIHHVLPALSFTSAGPSQLTSPTERRELVLPTARRPTAATRSATDHPVRTATPTPAQRPRSPPTHPRCRSRPAAPTPSSGSSATAQRVKCALISSARSANRRSQPRTVSACTPNRPAIRRYPSPATLASIAAPITDTSSCRRNNTRSGSSTCVPAHPRQRARRGRNNRSPDRAAQHPLPSVPPRAQHPPTRRTHKQPANQLSLDPHLLGAYDQHRVPPPASKRALPTTTKQTGGLSRVQKRAKPAKPDNAIPPTNGTNAISRAGIKRRSTRLERSHLLLHAGLSRRFPPVRSSPRLALPDGTLRLGLSPELRTPPTRSRRRTSGRGQAIEHGPETRSTSST